MSVSQYVPGGTNTHTGEGGKNRANLRAKQVILKFQACSDQKF